MPVVVTLPLTVLSAATVMLPAPEAEVFTAGTSSSPLNFSLTLSPFSAAKTEPEIISAIANPVARDRQDFPIALLILFILRFEGNLIDHIANSITLLC
jgi:hypothetical protein